MFKRSISRIAAAVVAVAALSFPFAAHAFCSMQSEPMCLTLETPFKNSTSFQWCKNEMDRYEKALKDYKACVLEEAMEEVRRKNDEAARKYNRAVDKFNCYARGERFCM